MAQKVSLEILRTWLKILVHPEILCVGDELKNDQG